MKAPTRTTILALFSACLWALFSGTTSADQLLLGRGFLSSATRFLDDGETTYYLTQIPAFRQPPTRDVVVVVHAVGKQDKLLDVDEIELDAKNFGLSDKTVRSVTGIRYGKRLVEHFRSVVLPALARAKPKLK